MHALSLKRRHQIISPITLGFQGEHQYFVRFSWNIGLSEWKNERLYDKLVLVGQTKMII